MTSISRSVASRISQTRLSGPSTPLDRRVNAYRPDLASVQLAADVIAARYAEPMRLHCTLPVAMLHGEADAAAVAVSALLHGEGFDVIEIAGDWAWGACVHDGYVGWLERAALTSTTAVATHTVVAAMAPVFAAPDIKRAVLAVRYLGSPLAGVEAGEFIALDGGGFIHLRHVARAGHHAGDPVLVARDFVGTPYVWGGRTRDGIDCSGLVQAALNACGIACPRDSDQQLAAFGGDIGEDALQRGDLVFFPGHVGIMADATRLLHANAYWMTTLIEPLGAVVGRLAGQHRQPVSGIGRPPKVKLL